MKILIINGPNLNLLGTREPEIYGTLTMEAYLEQLRTRFAEVEIDLYQSNSEGAIIDKLHSARGAYAGVVLNAGAYTHYSIAIADAIRAVSPLPVVEVHISNVAAREEFRRRSVIAPACRGSIVGFGMMSYDLAVEALTKEAAL